MTISDKIPLTAGRRALFLVGRDVLHPKAAGGDLQAWQWATHLATEGWQVEMISQSAPGRPSEETEEGVHILRLGNGPFLAFRAFRHYRRHSDSISLVYEDPIGAGRTPYLSPLYARVRVIAVWHQVTGGLLEAMHGKGVASAMSIVERVVARFYRRELLWVPSEERADEVSAELRIPRERIHVIPPTLATGIEIANTPIETAPRVLCLGVMRTYKHFDHVIRAIPAVRVVVPDVKLVIAGRHGSPQYEEDLRVLAEKLDVHDHVDFRFDLSDEERQDLMRHSAVLVLPSLLEGFGIVSIEANAEGVPVIASSGVPVGAVEHGVNGLRYPFGDIPALGAQIGRLLTDVPLRHKLGEAGIVHARALTTTAIAPQFDQLVRQALGEPLPSPRSTVATVGER